MTAVALAVALVVQPPPTVIAEGPPREVVVVVEGRAWRVRTVQLVTPGSGAPAPDTPPAPADPPADTEWTRLGRRAPVIGSVRATLAQHYSSFGERAARGEWATVKAMVDAEAPAYLAAIGDNRAITKTPRDAFLAAYERAWAAGNQTPDKMARLWVEYGQGLAQPIPPDVIEKMQTPEAAP